MSADPKTPSPLEDLDLLHSQAMSYGCEWPIGWDATEAWRRLRAALNAPSAANHWHDKYREAQSLARQLGEAINGVLESEQSQEHCLDPDCDICNSYSVLHQALAAFCQAKKEGLI
jgi:hypothetical protein